MSPLTQSVESEAGKSARRSTDQEDSDSNRSTSCLAHPEDSGNISKNSKTELLDLPREVRLMIYRFILVGSVTLDPIKIYDWFNDSSRGCALLRLNKAINDEATPIFYTENNFVIPFNYQKILRTGKWTRPPQTKLAFNELKDNCFLLTPQLYLSWIREVTIVIPFLVDKHEASADDANLYKARLPITEQEYLEFRIWDVLRTFPDMRVANILFAQYSSDRWHSPDLEGETVQENIFDAFKALYLHPNLEKIHLGVKLDGAPDSWPKTSAWEPFLGLFLLMKREVKHATREQNGVWRTKRRSWDRVITESGRSPFNEPRLWLILKKSTSG